MEQIERTHRYLNRIREIYTGVPANSDRQPYYLDDVHAFFVNCHHIRDWIVALNSLGITEHQVNEFIRSHRELKICADFCNATKHCRLRSKWTHRAPHLVRRSFVTTFRKDRRHTMRGKFDVLIDDQGNTYDVLAEVLARLTDP